MNSFRSILDKLNELNSKQDAPLNEFLGGLPSAIGRNVANTLRRTTIGAGKRDLEAKANALNKKWLEYRGQTNAIPNKANIESWIKNKLGMKTQEVWSQATDEFIEKYPKAGQKYIAEKPLDKYEVLNFFIGLVQVRLAYIERDLEKPVQQQQKTQQHKAPWWNGTKKPEEPMKGPKPTQPAGASAT